MFSPILSLSTFSLLLLISSSTASSQSSITVWPIPKTFSWPIPQSILLAKNFTISSPQHKYLTPAVNRFRHAIQTDNYHPLIRPSFKPSPALSLKALTLTVEDLQAPLHHGVNESYTLTVPNSGAAARITAATAWGAMRGLETLRQLAWGRPTQVAAGVYVSDAPVFGHRGLLLDTSRNYYEVEDILRTIEAMSWNKMNVFHWHITDSHSFPIAVPSEPELAAKGSYGVGMRYTAEDVRRVVEFGLERGVRVLPEIDMPGELEPTPLNSSSW